MRCKQHKNLNLYFIKVETRTAKNNRMGERANEMLSIVKAKLIFASRGMSHSVFLRSGRANTQKSGKNTQVLFQNQKCFVVEEFKYSEAEVIYILSFSFSFKVRKGKNRHFKTRA